jgi:uncharacterized membrane protein
MAQAQHTTKDGRTSTTLVHRVFILGIVAKALNGIVEILAGVGLFLVPPATLSHALLFLTRHELIEDPHDLLANYLVRVARQLSVHTQWFGAVYLLSHGVIKVGLVWALWQRHLWAYPAAIVFFLLFIIYQVYRYTFAPSPWLVVLTVVDLVVVWVTWLEYKRLQATG